MDEIQNSKNIATGPIDAGGNVHIGDNINLKEAADYIKLADETQSLNEDFNRTRAKVDQYPDDDDFKQDLLRIDAQRSQKEKDLSTLKREVLKLAEEFTRIPLNTERLRRAKEHFDKGEFKEARAILDAEKMAPELDAAIQKEALGQKLQEQARAERANLANEYLVLARLTAINFDLPDRFEQTKIYFEESLRAERNAENTFAYAHFLQEHNQYQEAPRLYEEVLQIYRSLAELNPQTWLPYVAMVLNNLAILHSDKNELAQAESKYEEALEIYQSLAELNPQTFLPHVAGTLNNLGLLHSDKNEQDQAEAEYEESLKIRRYLAQMNPQTYLPDVAGTLNNLGLLHHARNEQDQAEAEYKESLKIIRYLAQMNPQTYLPDVAGTLNNLANLHNDKNEQDQAEAEYEESLKIKRSLAQVNPQTYLPGVAITLNNLAVLHRAKNEQDQAEAECEEALKIYRSLAQVNPQTYLSYVAVTLNNLAVLHRAKNELAQAESEYEESLQIRRSLAKANPQTFLPDVAMTAVNMGLFYQGSVPDKEKSIAYCKEALRAALPFIQYLSSVQKYAGAAIQVIQAWEEDAEAILQEIRSEQQ